MVDEPEDDDPLLREFGALRQAVAEQLRGVARLETAISGMQAEVARKTGPEVFGETLAVIRKDVAGLAERLDAQEAAFGLLPDAKLVGMSVTAAMAETIQEMGRTRNLMHDGIRAAKDAAEQGRQAAQEGWGHTRKFHTQLHEDRRVLVLSLAGVLVLTVLAIMGGWHLRDWWAPPPSEIFARYVKAGNDPNWLLCNDGNGKRLSTDKGTPVCELRFWLEKTPP